MLLTKAQRKALHRVWLRGQNEGHRSYLAFRRTVFLAFNDGCIMVRWAGMWLGIEKDGYTHS